MSEKLGFRENMTDAEIVGLYRKDNDVQEFWGDLDIKRKKEFIKLYKSNKREFDRKLESEILKINPTYKNHFLEKENDNLIKFFVSQGINSPTETTLDAFIKQRVDANFDKVLNSLGMFTTNREKQAQYNYYVTQQKQNFIEIAQNDKIIKQNDEIISLLKKISNK